MAIIAVGGGMGPDKRKPALLVKFSNVIDDPGGRCMATGTIWSDGLIVHIGMTVNAFCACLCKFKRSVAHFAAYGRVLSGKRKLCGPVIEGEIFQVDLPAGCTVTFHAVQLNSRAMGRCLGEKSCREYQDKYQ